VTDGRSVCESVYWNVADKPIPTGVFDMVYEPVINEYNQNRTIQLKMLDWQPR
jgi:hypothetical protein